MARKSTTAKGRVTVAGKRSRYANVCTGLRTNEKGVFVLIAIGTTDVAATLTPDNARRLADHLHDFADAADAAETNNKPERNNQ